MQHPPAPNPLPILWDWHPCLGNPGSATAMSNVFTSVCHSVHRGSVRQTPPLGRHTPRQTPPRQTSLLGRYSPRQTHPPGQTPPWADTPLGRHTLGQTSLWADTLPGRHPQGCARFPEICTVFQ